MSTTHTHTHTHTHPGNQLHGFGGGLGLVEVRFGRVLEILWGGGGGGVVQAAPRPAWGPQSTTQVRSGAGDHLWGTGVGTGCGPEWEEGEWLHILIYLCLKCNHGHGH